MQHYKLSDIYIYPVKSLGAIRISNTKTTEKGLQYDRRWMLVDNNNQFMTIRKYPNFLFFHLYGHKEGFRISFNASYLDIPFSIASGDLIQCTIWDSKVEAIKGDERWSRWFSEQLGIPCSLVYMPDKADRRIKPLWGGTTVSFADGYPLLITCEASLTDLNEKLDEPVEMMRFRPNLVFNGGEAYDEFRWGSFNIGHTKFQGLKPCTRCIVTTYNTITGEKGRQPLLALSKQKIDNNIVFGQHAKSLESGEIRVGDNLQILNYKSDPYAAIPGLSL
ncbi:MAG: MOSC N-terminal beta barrel domain-containing protein [Bacteroidota bacterium]